MLEGGGVKLRRKEGGGGGVSVDKGGGRDWELSGGWRGG